MNTKCSKKILLYIIRKNQNTEFNMSTLWLINIKFEN